MSLLNSDPASILSDGSEPAVLWNPRVPEPEHGLPPAASVPAGHLVFGTSGSSGTPKLLCLSRTAMLASAEAVCGRLEVTPADRWLCALPLFHVGGMAIHVRSRVSGCRVVTGGEKWSAAEFCRIVDEQRITIASVVPAQLHDLTAAGLPAPASLRVLMTGGGALGQPLAGRAAAEGWPVRPAYGLTEAASTVSIGEDVRGGGGSQPGQPVLSHLQARIESDGRLSLRGASLFSGSMEHTGGGWQFIPRQGDWHTTSDLAALEGNRLTILGRCDRTLKIRGELVNLDSLEVLLPPGCALAARPDERNGWALVVATEAGRGAEPPIRAAAAAFPPYARLADVIHTPALPRSPLGKFLRSGIDALISASLPRG